MVPKASISRVTLSEADVASLSMDDAHLTISQDATLGTGLTVTAQAVRAKLRIDLKQVEGGNPIPSDSALAGKVDVVGDVLEFCDVFLGSPPALRLRARRAPFHRFGARQP